MLCNHITPQLNPTHNQPHLQTQHRLIEGRVERWCGTSGSDTSLSPGDLCKFSLFSLFFVCIIYHCGFFHLPFLLFERAHLLPKLVRGFPYLSLKLSLAPSSCFTLSALWKLGELLREGETGVISQANHSHHTNRCRRDKVRERERQFSSVQFRSVQVSAAWRELCTYTLSHT